MRVYLSPRATRDLTSIFLYLDARSKRGRVTSCARSARAFGSSANILTHGKQRIFTGRESNLYNNIRSRFSIGYWKIGTRSKSFIYDTALNAHGKVDTRLARCGSKVAEQIAPASGVKEIALQRHKGAGRLTRPYSSKQQQLQVSLTATRTPPPSCGRAPAAPSTS
jgi:hypothetical protein